MIDKKLYRRLMGMACALILFALVVVLSARAWTAQTPAGIWQGMVTGKPGTVQFFFTIEKKDTGAYMAKVDIPAQKARAIPVTEVRWTAPELFLDMSSFGITFQGRMADGGARIDGRLKIGDEDLPLFLTRTDAVPEQPRPQEPRKPYPYEVSDVTFRNPEAGIELSGTLTVPRGEGPFPAAVLISGSGPQDRDSTLAGHKPFLVLADALTRRGIAVLCYDDRGCGKSGGDFHKATTADFAGDARAAWDFLRRQPRIDARRVGLIGHSEGAMAAPMVAAKTPEVAFIVLLAGSGVSGERIFLTQQEAGARSQGAGEEAVRKQNLFYRRFLEVARKQSDPRLAEEEMRPIIAEAASGMSDTEKKELRLSEESLIQDIKGYFADYPWCRFLLGYDPAVDLRRVHCPVLALNGDKDTQVLADLNVGEIERALKEGGNSRYEVRRLPGLNHLFQTAQTGHPREYGRIEETFSPTALKIIGDWILARAAFSKD
jgi:pimeloyl-ACP methyl ester carboxylesterase